jgi:hypothetical protein
MTAAPSAHEVETFHWVARGFTDDVTDCQHCGRTDLKGTVRMVALSDEGEELGDWYLGVVCAARKSGRKAAQIRHEATRADRQRRDAARKAWMDWMDAKSIDFCARRDAALGPDRSPRECIEWSRTEQAKAGDAAWLAANPEPTGRW